MDRRGLFLKHIADVGRVGVEVGALNRPAVTRDDADVRYLDHVDTAGLRRKYHDDPAVDVSQIVEVDHVWQGEPLSTVIGDDARLDFFVASHVIEHVPNLIGWLNEIHGVLRPGGRLLLIVPDKRFTFDARRRCTELTDVIEDHLEDRRRPSYRHIFGQLSQASAVDATAVWRDASGPAPLLPGHGTLAALGACRHARATGAYHDVHCSVFTPFSFINLLRELIEAEPGLLRLFRCVEIVPTRSTTSSSSSRSRLPRRRRPSRGHAKSRSAWRARRGMPAPSAAGASWPR